MLPCLLRSARLTLSTEGLAQSIGRSGHGLEPVHDEDQAVVLRVFVDDRYKFLEDSLHDLILLFSEIVLSILLCSTESFRLSVDLPALAGSCFVVQFGPLRFKLLL